MGDDQYTLAFTEFLDSMSRIARPLKGLSRAGRRLHYYSPKLRTQSLADERVSHPKS
jgi:hypothetical protein